MTDAVAAAAGGPVPAIDSRAAFAQALRWGLRRAVALHARQVHFVDTDFAGWPLDDADMMGLLAGWLRRPGRRLTLLAAGYDEVPRRWPRFTRWRHDWGHAIECWQLPREAAPALPTLLVADRGVSVHLIDAVHWRGRADDSVRTAVVWQEQIDALLQRSERAFAVDTLGL
ncbi:MAG: hypothetical protein KGI90_05900 [Burkholderiales bacterium]|nr:hypothetical protein [Burkholderiales bacterium]